MKFVVSYQVKEGGSVEERVKGGQAAQKLLADWAPGAQIHQWLQRCDGTGGFAVSETDDAATLYRDLSLWAPWLDFEVIPVLDIGESTPIGQEALDRAQSVL